MNRVFRIVSLVLLAWLPLQAVALPVLALNCHAAASAAVDGRGADTDFAADAAHEHHAVAGDADTASGAVDDSRPAGHMCCTHFTAVTSTVVPAAAPAVVQALATPAPRATSHLPEPPQQPPRATLL